MGDQKIRPNQIFEFTSDQKYSLKETDMGNWQEQANQDQIQQWKNWLCAGGDFRGSRAPRGIWPEDPKMEDGIAAAKYRMMQEEALVNGFEYVSFYRLIHWPEDPGM